MSTLLVTNDDGVTSPALVPLIRALERIDGVERVNALVPDRERSWISKAISRFEDIRVEERKSEDDDPRIMTATGTPADCANLGIHRVFDHNSGDVINPWHRSILVRPTIEVHVVILLGHPAR